MYEITMNLTSDWIKTATEVLKGSGRIVEDSMSDDQVAKLYFGLTLSDEQTVELASETLARLKEIETTIWNHMDDVIVPDIRTRTRYEGNTFQFFWVYNQGEHIIEMNSEYRIPL